VHGLALQLASGLALAAEADRRGLVRSALWLWIGLGALGLALIALVWVFASGWARAALGARGRGRRQSRFVDAWAEAGRRAEPLPPDDVQIDADDSHENGEASPPEGRDG
jgi:hypothetical protein